MELKEVANTIFSLLGVDSHMEFTNALKNKIYSKEFKTFCDKYIELFPDLSIDWMQRIYQFYCSERKEKKQDYTPVSLSRLVAALTATQEEKSVYDCCAGSGSLTIQKWCLNKNLHYVCEELDDNVIPVLLFNLCIRNIEATVTQKNVLTGETFKSYQTIKGDKYASVQEMLFPRQENEIADISISNPPFNIKSEISNAIKENLPSKYSSNFAFAANCLNRAKRFAALILPLGCLTNAAERECRAYFLEKGWLKAAISLPEKMFESTPVATCILLFDKEKTSKYVMLIDATKMSSVEIREQRGEGEASHYNRIYKKEFNTISDVQILAICELVNKEQEGISKLINYKEAESKNFNFTIGVYLPIAFEGTTHRDFNAIIKDINRIIRERNIIKVSVNKVWAKELGLDKVIEDCITNNEVVKAMNESFKMFTNYTVEENIIENKYIQSSNSKVFVIENTDKEILSSIMPFFIQMYKQHIFFLNNEENRLLAELRESMLPYLLTGKLKVEANQKDAI